jgi:hypothetical protein
VEGAGDGDGGGLGRCERRWWWVAAVVAVWWCLRPSRDMDGGQRRGRGASVRPCAGTVVTATAAPCEVQGAAVQGRGRLCVGGA